MIGFAPAFLQSTIFFSKKWLKERIFELLGFLPILPNERTSIKKELVQASHFQKTFLQNSRKNTAVNGVLFIDLHSYKAYRPIGSGDSFRSWLILKSGNLCGPLMKPLMLGMHRQCDCRCQFFQKELACTILIPKDI